MHDNHWRAFGSHFYILHQKKILWLLNDPRTKDWFRYVLRIHKDVDRKDIICEIGPNYYKVFLGFSDGKFHYRLDARTHDKFSKRLYFAFKPAWWMAHSCDSLILDRWVPELSFGLGTLTVYPDADPESTSVDGRVSRGVSIDETWATIIAGAGDGVDDATASGSVLRIIASATTNQWSWLSRCIYLFDTSALTRAASISASVMSLYGAGAGADDMLILPTVDIYTATPASNTSLAASDYSQCDTVSQTGSPMAYAIWNQAAYNDFTFNATGLGNVSKTGISKFSFRNANYDVAGVDPTNANWGSGLSAYFTAYYSDQTGTTNDPKLVVTYTIYQYPGPSYESIIRYWSSK